MCHRVAGRCTRMVITFVIYRQVIARLELRSGYRRAVPPWGRNTIQHRTSRFPATPRVSAWCSPGALHENSKVRRVCRAEPWAYLEQKILVSVEVSIGEASRLAPY